MAVGRKHSLNIDNRFSGIGKPFGPKPAEIYVACEGDRKIKVYSEIGVLKRQWNQINNYVPRGIFFYQNEVFNASPWIDVYTPTGTFKRNWVRTGTMGIYVASENNYVYEASSSSYIQVDDRWGVGKYYHSHPSPIDICVYNNEVYLTSTSEHNVKVYDIAIANVLRQWGSWGSNDGQFKTPQGVRVYKDEVFIADNGNVRVQVFTTGGTFKRKFTTKYSAVYLSILNDEIYMDECAQNKIYVHDLNGGFKREWSASTTPGFLHAVAL